MGLVHFSSRTCLRHDLFYRPEHESAHGVVLAAQELVPGSRTHPIWRNLETPTPTRDESNHSRIRVAGKLASGGSACPPRRELGTSRSTKQSSAGCSSRPFGSELWSPRGSGNGDIGNVSHCHAIAAGPTRGASHRTAIPGCRLPADVRNDDAFHTGGPNHTKAGLLRPASGPAPTHGGSR
jgi:hypothetical protein